MLKSLDPHSDYMDRKAFQEFNEKQRSEYFGLRAQIGVRNRATYVLEPFRRSPAARAGLQYGDHIAAVNGEDTSSWTAERMRKDRKSVVEGMSAEPGHRRSRTKVRHR